MTKRRSPPLPERDQVVRRQQALSAILALREAGQRREAEIRVQELLRANPLDAEATNIRGVVAVEQGRSQEAAEWYQRAVDLEPRNAAFTANLGNALLACGQLGAAIASYVEALALNPEDSAAVPHRGTAGIMSGGYQLTRCF